MIKTDVKINQRTEKQQNQQNKKNGSFKKLTQSTNKIDQEKQKP